MSDQPPTRSQIDKLGRRLRYAKQPSDTLLDQLQAFRARFDGPLGVAQDIVAKTLGAEPTARIKTINTILEKLVRSKTRLSTMQDIAGVRVVLDSSFKEQDVAVARIRVAFEGSQVDDLRDTPRFGYRAVHVIVTVEQFPVEIQVRTRLQDMWAQGMEKLADKVGRGIRYGEPPLVMRLGDTDVASILRLGEALSVAVQKHEGLVVMYGATEEALNDLKGLKARTGIELHLPGVELGMPVVRGIVVSGSAALHQQLAKFAEILSRL